MRKFIILFALTVMFAGTLDNPNPAFRYRQTPEQMFIHVFSADNVLNNYTGTFYNLDPDVFGPGDTIATYVKFEQGWGGICSGWIAYQNQMNGTVFSAGKDTVLPEAADINYPDLADEMEVIIWDGEEQQAYYAILADLWTGEPFTPQYMGNGYQWYATIARGEPVDDITWFWVSFLKSMNAKVVSITN